MNSSNEIFVGRQPIYDKKLELFAYELLFRSSKVNEAVITDGERATSELLANTFMEIGLEKIVGRAPAFLNVTRDFILGNYPIPPLESRIALEILEDTVVDDALIAAVNELSQRGYMIVLDDFEYHESLRPLVDLADIIKIDVLALGRAATEEHVGLLRKCAAGLLAEKVETQEDFEFCKGLGFDYYQGYFFCRPKVIKGARLPVNRMSVMQLLQKLQDPGTEYKELEQIIVNDTTLSYKILRLINSAFYTLPRKVESIHQALVILGLRDVTNWASLIMMSRIDDKPAELMILALVRAKMCELLAGGLKFKDVETFFTVGLFSVLDALLDRPMHEVVAELPLSEDVNQGLLRFSGRCGRVLFCVLSYERGDWQHVNCLGLKKEAIRDAYLAAVQWADEVGGMLKSP